MLLKKRGFGMVGRAQALLLTLGTSIANVSHPSNADLDFVDAYNIVKKAVYIALAIRLDGQKEVLWDFSMRRSLIQAVPRGYTSVQNPRALWVSVTSFKAQIPIIGHEAFPSRAVSPLISP